MGALSSPPSRRPHHAWFSSLSRSARPLRKIKLSISFVCGLRAVSPSGEKARGAPVGFCVQQFEKAACDLLRGRPAFACTGIFALRARSFGCTKGRASRPRVSQHLEALPATAVAKAHTALPRQPRCRRLPGQAAPERPACRRAEEPMSFRAALQARLEACVRSFAAARMRRRADACVVASSSA